MQQQGVNFNLQVNLSRLANSNSFLFELKQSLEYITDFSFLVTRKAVVAGSRELHGRD